MNTNQILLAAAMEEAMPLNFETLPLTEVGADATHFVCEMKGSGTETGVGAGLAGADLDLTPFGTVGAASSDWRAVSAASGFNITSAFINAFVRNASGFTILHHMKNCGGSGALFYLNSEVPSNLYIRLNGTNFWAYGTGKFGVSLGVPTATLGDFLPTADEFWSLLSVDYINELAFVGVSVGLTQPAALADFPAYGVSALPQAPIASAITLYANFFGLVGATAATGEQNPTFSIKSVTAKLGASVTLA